MATTTAGVRRSTRTVNALTTGRLPKAAPLVILLGSWVVMGVVFALLNAAGVTETFNWVGAIVLGTVLYAALVFVVAMQVEGIRRAKDRVVTTLVSAAFIIALVPLVSLLITVVTSGTNRFDADFFSMSMRNIVGAGGGGLHAVTGTLLITALAAVISVPIGLLTAIYLVEYGQGRLARSITFFVDVMTGIPSIVAGLFAYALFVIFFGAGVRMGAAGSVALAVLMIPVVVRSTEEMLKLVPNELREASYALGVPKWLTILKVVIPTSVAGITTGVMLAIARVVGETAPLLITAGFTANMNYNLFGGAMQSLPVFAYSSYVSQGTDAAAFIDRAWTSALTLILLVMALNLLARVIARVFAPKLGR
ncbi:phosphate ABC transporter permease PstA [Frigoribacterium sp. 2355]